MNRTEVLISLPSQSRLMYMRILSLGHLLEVNKKEENSLQFQQAKKVLASFETKIADPKIDNCGREAVFADFLSFEKEAKDVFRTLLKGEENERT
jgi:hypothetical protein